MNNHFETRVKMPQGSLAAVLADGSAAPKTLLRQLAEVKSQVLRLRDDAATPDDAREVDAFIGAIEKAVADLTRRVRPGKRTITVEDRQRLDRIRKLLPSLADGRPCAIELDADPIRGAGVLVRKSLRARAVRPQPNALARATALPARTERGKLGAWQRPCNRSRRASRMCVMSMRRRSSAIYGRR